MPKKNLYDKIMRIKKLRKTKGEIIVANIKSAKKRILTNKRQKEENKLVKSSLSTFIKKYKKLLAENKVAEAEAMLPELVAAINSAASKGVLHQNNASRKVARLSAALSKVKGHSEPKEAKHVEAKPAVEEKVVESAPAKKTTTTKKATATKTASTKTTAAKSTTKTATAKTTTTKAATTKKATTKTATEKAEPAKKATTAKKTTTTKKTAAKKDAE